MKFFSLCSTAIALTMLNANGFCEIQMADMESRVSQLEKTKSPSAFSYNDSQSSQSIRPSLSGQMQAHALTTARAYPGVSGPYFDVEFLWLRAVEDGLEYAWKMEGTLAKESPVCIANVKILDQDWKFDPGFRVGLGYNLDYDDWDVHAYYTWLHSCSKAFVSVPPFSGEGTCLVGLFAMYPNAANEMAITFGPLEDYQVSKSSWQLQFNAWDLDLGRNNYVGKRFSLHPVAGLKVALIRQDLSSYYNSDPVVKGSVPVKQKTRFWAVGPKVGVFGSWQLGYGFSINGDMHGALVYGEFNSCTHAAVIRNNADDIKLHVTEDLYRLRPMAYLNLGLDWGRCFSDQMYFSFHLGWETQYWWDQMQFISFKDLTPHGALSLTGLNTGIRFDF